MRATGAPNFGRHGVTDGTVARNLAHYGIPIRPAGVHSRSDMLARLPTRIPQDIRRAVEGGLHGWQRLHRFQIAMTFPTINDAATHLGADQSTLVRQFRRLEHDIGTRLFDRSTPTQSMRPTPRGVALLQALARKDTGNAWATTEQHPRVADNKEDP